MPRKDITVAQDETFASGLCRVSMDSDSNFIILEQLAQARDPTTWNDLLAPTLAPLNCQVMQSTSDEAPGLLAYVEHYLEAHHPGDQVLVPVQDCMMVSPFGWIAPTAYLQQHQLIAGTER